MYWYTVGALHEPLKHFGCMVYTYMYNVCMYVHKLQFFIIHASSKFVHRVKKNITRTYATIKRYKSVNSQSTVLIHRRKPPIQSHHNSKHQIYCQTWQSRYTQEHTTSEATDQQSQPGGGMGR